MNSNIAAKLRHIAKTFPLTQEQQADLNEAAKELENLATELAEANAAIEYSRAAIKAAVDGENEYRSIVEKVAKFLMAPMDFPESCGGPEAAIMAALEQLSDERNAARTGEIENLEEIMRLEAKLNELKTLIQGCHDRTPLEFINTLKKIVEDQKSS